MTHPPTQNIMILKKKKVVKISTLDNKLWRIFSKYIRLRDRIQDDYCKCISCGSIHHWKAIHAGHFLSRRHKQIKYDEQNVHSQCVTCNSFEEGNQYKYGLALIEKYGDSIINDLHARKKLNKIPDRLWYIEQIKIYQDKLKEME